jgi:hypothetical protein
MAGLPARACGDRICKYSSEIVNAAMRAYGQRAVSLPAAHRNSFGIGRQLPCWSDAAVLFF